MGWALTMLSDRVRGPDIKPDGGSFGKIRRNEEGERAGGRASRVHGAIAERERTQDLQSLHHVPRTRGERARRPSLTFSGKQLISFSSTAFLLCKFE